MVAVSSRASFVQETSTTTGTGTYSLAGAVAGFQGFVAGNGDGAIVRYAVTDGTSWEVCEGTVTDAATDTLSRGTVLESSNAGAAVNWGAGTKTISQVLTPGEVCGKFLIESITLGSAGEFDFDSIPQVYRRLIVEGVYRSSAAVSIDSSRWYLNADTTDGNYHFQLAGANNGASAFSEGANPDVAAAVGDSAPAGSYTHVRAYIEQYTGSQLKGIASTWGGEQAADSLRAAVGFVTSAITDPVTRLRIRTDNHPTDGLVGTLTLYGEL